MKDIAKVIFNKFFILFVLFPFYLFSQKQDSFKSISFTQKDSITNLEEYKKGQREIITQLENKTVDFTQSLTGRSSEKISETNRYLVDSLVNSMSQNELDKSIIVYHYKNIDKSIWKRWEAKENGDTLSLPVFMDLSKEKEYYRYPYDGIDQYSYIFDKIKSLKIKEFRKDRKSIQGVECFRIKCSYSRIIEHQKEDNGEKIPDDIYKIEADMWVAEEIKSIYHPAFKVREILEKYYPLYIEEKSSQSPGMIRKIILHEMN
ncbi:hypothetical protein [Chryseobacterium lineare]